MYVAYEVRRGRLRLSLLFEFPNNALFLLKRVKPLPLFFIFPGRANVDLAMT